VCSSDLKTIVIINAEKYTEIVSTLEVVLDRKFEGASLTTLIRAVDERISELDGAAKQEDQSGAVSLEIRVLEEQLKNLTSLGGSPK
jgi:hypothetical protein